MTLTTSEPRVKLVPLTPYLTFRDLSLRPGNSVFQGVPCVPGLASVPCESRHPEANQLKAELDINESRTAVWSSWLIESHDIAIV